MKKEVKLMNFFIFVGLIIIVGFNFYIYRNEFKVLSDPNDNIFQYALVDQAKNVWKNIFSGKLSPFYLLDSWNERWGDGFALSSYYSHLPQAVISLIGFILPIDTYKLFVVLRTLIFVLMPLMFFWAGTVLCLPSGFSLILALFSQAIFTNGLYGIDVSSFIWRGWGLSAELMATFLLPVAFAYAIDYFQNKRNLGKAVLFNFLCAQAHIGIFLLLCIGYGLYLLFFLIVEIVSLVNINEIKIKSISTVPKFKIAIKNLKEKIIPFFTFILITLFSLSYFIVPFFLQGQYRNFSVWDPIWKFDSWGAKQVIIWFLNGELFDYNRFPLITLCVIFGVLYGLIEKKKILNYLSFSFLFFLVLFFGRTTLGKIVDLIPGFGEYHIHRVIVMVQFIGLFLGAWFLYNLIDKIFLLVPNIYAVIIKSIDVMADIPHKISSSSTLDVFRQKTTKNISLLILIVSICTGLYLIYYLEQPVVKYAEENNTWITRSNNSYLYDLDAYEKIKARLATLPTGRVYAGRPGNWGRNFYVGETPMYMALSRDGFSSVEFLPESWSPNSDPEEFFDENSQNFYNLYNVRYSILPPEVKPPDFVKFIVKEGRYSLYQIQTSGWFDFGKTNIMVRSKKTNLLDITRLWFGSNLFRNGDYPVIDLSNKDPAEATPVWAGRLWQISMSDLNHFVNMNDGKERDIWQANPMVAIAPYMPNVKVKEDENNVLVNGYTSTFTLDKDCKNCFVILKESFHPNWKIILDGSIVSPSPVFPFFIGIPVEKAGTHKIKAVYEPGILKVLLVWVEIIGFGVWILVKKYKRFFI